MAGTSDLKPQMVVVWVQPTDAVLELTKRLAALLGKAGHRVHLVGAVRDLEVHAHLAVKENGGDEPLDISGSQVKDDAASVLEWARQFRKKEPEIGAVINLGLYEGGGDRQQGSDNFEKHFLMNFVLPVALVAGLGRAVSAARGRVVNVVTPAYRTDGILWDDMALELGAFTPSVAVSQSQTALVMHAFALQGVLKSAGVRVAAVNVGCYMGSLTDVEGEEYVLVDDAVELVAWAATDPSAPAPAAKLLDQSRSPVEADDADCNDASQRSKLFNDTCNQLGLPADPMTERGEDELDDSLFGAVLCCGGR